MGMDKRKGKYTAPSDSGRCTIDIKLRDGSEARCMRRRAANSDYCWQHHRAAIARAEGRS